jgi:UDP-3-O-[3-hydroxymyristoyl] glucosamine N-acyltransferase
MKIEKNDVLQLLARHSGVMINEARFVPPASIRSIAEAGKDSLVFVDAKAKNKDRLISQTGAAVIICDRIPEDAGLYADKCLIVVSNPKLFFAQLVNQRLPAPPSGIHPAAVVESDMVGDGCHIGPNVYIGKEVKIGRNVFIHSNCSIYDRVEIGDRVAIDAGCVIGLAGFGFVRDGKSGCPTRFPQLGRVIIEDDVEIGANVSISRGALQDTVIRRGVKIDSLSIIGHNVEIGEYTYIIAASIVAGSTKIGKRCWIASSKIINKITIGDDVTVGYGSVVLKSIPSGRTYMGNPARDIEQPLTPPSKAGGGAGIDRFIEHFSGQFDAAAVESVTADTKFKDLDEWSSIMALSIVAMVDIEYDVTLRRDEINRAATVGDLYLIVQSKIRQDGDGALPASENNME